MAVLISLLLPSLAMAREATNRIRCASNIKQLGAGLVMYASDNADLMPYSVFGDPAKGEPEPQNTLFVHLDPHPRVQGRSFDGLGLLSGLGYIDRPESFYCPSHTGNHTFEQYTSRWATQTGIISSNYQFRLFEGRQYSSRLDPWTALIADGMRTPLDYNHEVGHNMLTNDMAVRFVGLEVLPEPLAVNFSSNANDSVTMASLIFAGWAAMDSLGGGRSTDGNLTP